jgi:hypothetical protein
MITYELNTDEFANLVIDTLYEDADSFLTSDGEGDYYVINSPSMMAHVYVWTIRAGIPVITPDRYESLKTGVSTSGFTPLAIVGTPDGAFEFNLDTMKLKFEPFSDGDKPDIKIAELPIEKGKRILDFYPEFSSHDEYLDSLMGDAEPSMYDEEASW